MSNISKIRKAVEEARVSVGDNERINFDKNTRSRVPCFTDLYTGCWNCGSMIYAC